MATAFAVMCLIVCFHHALAPRPESKESEEDTPPQNPASSITTPLASMAVWNGSSNVSLSGSRENFKLASSSYSKMGFVSLPSSPSSTRPSFSSAAMNVDMGMYYSSKSQVVLNTTTAHRFATPMMSQTQKAPSSTESDFDNMNIFNTSIIYDTSYVYVFTDVTSAIWSPGNITPSPTPAGIHKTSSDIDLMASHTPPLSPQQTSTTATSSVLNLDNVTYSSLEAIPIEASVRRTVRAAASSVPTEPSSLPRVDSHVLASTTLSATSSDSQVTNSTMLLVSDLNPSLLRTDYPDDARSILNTATHNDRSTVVPISTPSVSSPSIAHNSDMSDAFITSSAIESVYETPALVGATILTSKALQGVPESISQDVMLTSSKVMPSTSNALGPSSSPTLSLQPSVLSSSSAGVSVSVPVTTHSVFTPTDSNQVVTSLPTASYVPISCTLIMTGDCAPVLADKETFIEAFKNSISSYLSTDPSRFSVSNLSCGSIVVDFILKDNEAGDFSENLEGFMEESPLSMSFKGHDLATESFVFHNGSYAHPSPTPSDTGGQPPIIDDGGNGLTFQEQQRLVYILIAVVVGFVIFLAILLVIHHVLRRVCKRSAQSFDLQEEPCIKLTDFNAAHTCIPRPRSIYSSTGTNGSFYRSHNREDEGNLPGSPSSSFRYAASSDVRNHHEAVVDSEHQPLASNGDHQLDRDVGSGELPEWNLSLSDGAPLVTNAGPDLLTAIESQYSSQPSTSSDTTRPPSTASSTLTRPPVFAPPAPPPPPPPPLPTPVMKSGTLQSRRSCDAGSEMTDSSGDTNTLTKGSSDLGTSMMGIDNPLMMPEEDYMDAEPSTSNRSERYILR